MYLSSVSSRLILHDVDSWDLKKSYGCYEGLIRDISWSDDGKYLLQVNPKGLVEILNTGENDVCSLQHVPFRDTWSASFHRDGHRNVAIGTRSGNVLIWDTKNKTITKTFPTPTQQSPVNYISYNAKNTCLAASMQNGDTVIYGLISNIPVLTIKLSCSKSISAMKFHYESRAILGLVTDEGHVVLKDVTTNKDKVFFENVHASPVSDFVFSPVNKDVMLSSGHDKVMHVYDIRLQNVVSTIRTSHPLSSIAINLDNKVALGDKNGLILIYDLRDLTNPFKTLKGHDYEVKKVCFQSLRKKSMSTEISLHEDTETIPCKISSPVKGTISDMFHISVPTLPKINISAHVEDNKDESFLVMMGLDKTNDHDEEGFIEIDRKSDMHELGYRQLDAERNISKVSTPLNSRIPDIMLPSPIRKSDMHELWYPQSDAERNISKVSTPLNSRIPDIMLPSPICANGTSEHNGTNGNLSQGKPSNVELQRISSLITQSMDELKDFVKLTQFEVAYENRNHFLHIMMAATKQKLFLEKQLSSMNLQINGLVENQNVLVEMNRKLSLEIDLLKSKQS